jgi:hypothetical protein
LAKKKQETKNELIEQLCSDMEAAWNSLRPLRDTWTEKEQTLLAKNTDSFSGKVTRARVTDAALSTFTFERQARVAAQLPSGKVYATGSKDDGKAKLANIVLQRYIIPNAGQGYDMLTLQRLWGVYASVYGSMPMFYDYMVSAEYIGPYAQLIDPRMFMPQPGRNTTKECDWVMVSTLVSIEYLRKIAEKKETSWDKKAINKLIEDAKDGMPSRVNDSEKDSNTATSRYSRGEYATGQIELVTKYEAGEDGRWITFAPDFKDAGVLRDIPNPHKSGRIPVVMRHCFPLMNSIYGLGDFERGMKIQKAKDSFLGLRLEFAKNLVFPSMKINLQNVTPSTVKHGAGNKILVTDMNNSVEYFQPGQSANNEFQATYAVLNSIQQNQFGTTTTDVSSENSANPSMGKTPEALKIQSQRENARDTWDRFMHEQAVQELYEGMINLLCVKMEKPINFQVFEEEIRQLVGQYGEETLDAIAGNKVGNMTVSKSDMYSKNGFKYVIDANTSMKKDDEEQTQALMMSFQLLANPAIMQQLAQSGYTYDLAEHVKQIMIASGINDWDRILQEGNQNQNGDMTVQEQAMAEEEAAMIQQETEAMKQQALAQFQDPEIQAIAQQMLGGQPQPQPMQGGMM